MMTLCVLLRIHWKPIMAVGQKKEQLCVLNCSAMNGTLLYIPATA